ncbi:MAG: hypothetical protein MZV70_65500 [Desulfobacterales bacterium]|nr:hypothetical protein [Desulfobacterales bacterium]
MSCRRVAGYGRPARGRLGPRADPCLGPRRLGAGSARVGPRCRITGFLSAGDLEKRRRGHRIQWTYLLFRERFGSNGAERLGGEERIFERLEGAGREQPLQRPAGTGAGPGPEAEPRTEAQRAPCGGCSSISGVRRCVTFAGGPCRTRSATPHLSAVSK